jgi:hypothetical protein
LDELLGDFGLALQPGQPEWAVHPRHRLPALESTAHDGDHLAVGGGLLGQRPGWQQVEAARSSASVSSG